MITLSDLYENIKNSKDNEYMFIKVLDSNDVDNFISKIPVKCYDEICKYKKIRLHLWINIVSSINSKIEYRVYRQAFVNEHLNNHFIYKYSDKYVVKMLSIPDKEEQTFYKMFMSMFKTKHIKHILLTNYEMKSIDICKNYYLSPVENIHFSIETCINNKDKLF